MVTVHSSTAPVHLHNTPRQHNTILALYPRQLQLGLLRQRSVGSFRGQPWWLWCLWERGRMYRAWWLLSNVRAIRERSESTSVDLIHHSPGKWKQMSLQSPNYHNSLSPVYRGKRAAANVEKEWDQECHRFLFAYKFLALNMIVATIICLYPLCFPPKRWQTEHCSLYQG